MYASCLAKKSLFTQEIQQIAAFNSILAWESQLNFNSQ
ncbi:hypothetical protein AM1_A0023 (plasmid) [Acaryochloris marina MBIC11017]|uniref:Uncharacterized protein n=1 Tax=Acaryochloris marina (strain MBIC 11017) TaxID=329726 RepID=A8ZK32_ACAM1|nr:hypothetical protein AM1_A0023 [Acaryochloris marina MBIC11017]